MSVRRRQLLIWPIALLLAAGAAWLRLTGMEKRWVAQYSMSQAALQNPMLAASRLLDRHGHPTSMAGTLTDALRGPLADGTLILAGHGGIVTREQANRLLAWARRGNTIVFRPEMAGRTIYYHCGEHGAVLPPARKRRNDAVDTDPLGRYVGVELAIAVRRTDAEPASAGEPAPMKKTAHTPCLSRITVPDSGHTLALDVDRVALQSIDGRMAPLLTDAAGDAVRIYPAGAGRIAVVADNYFDNDNLAWNDNAELLLMLADLNRRARRVLVIQHLDMPAWYRALWWQFPLGISASACALLLLLWRALRRFGPLLPEPSLERRALLEHIDASGRWLWKLPHGRNLLLAAARRATEKTLLRRAPQLHSLPAAERARRLAEACGLAPDAVVRALDGPAAGIPLEFTRQIRTLQQLRHHYDH